MAIATGHAKIWSARIINAFEKASLYFRLVTDVGTEWPGYGKSISFPKLTTAPTIGDYTRDTDINFQQLTDADEELVLDQAKYFAFTVDDVDQAYVRPSYVDSFAAKCGAVLAQTFDNLSLIHI